jgi:hypothetical protein
MSSGDTILNSEEGEGEDKFAAPEIQPDFNFKFPGSMRRLIPPNFLQPLIPPTIPAIHLVANGALLVKILMVAFVTLDRIEG